MNILFTAAPGTSLRSKSLPNANLIQGIEIDNPSGNWLFIVSEKIYCPPYTIGWAMPLSYYQSSIDVEARLTGPAGQVGTNQGDAWQLTLYDYPLNPSAGVPYQFVQQFTGNSTASALLANVPAGTVGNVILTIAAIANKRFRIKTITLTVNKLLVSECNVYFHLFNGTTEIGSVDIFPPDHTLFFNYGEGLDIGVGNKFEITADGSWKSANVDALVTYQTL